MPISPMNYAALPTQGDPLMRGLADAIMQGIQGPMAIKQMMQQSQGDELSNALRKIQLQYAPKMQEADLAAKLAQAQASQSGQNLPGVAGDIMALESIKSKFGENSQQYKQALDAFNLQQASTSSRIGYQDALAQTLPNRSLTPTGKSIIEQTNVDAGLMPTGAQVTNPLPASASDLSGTYNLVRQKGATDEDARKRTRFATNIEKTLSNINVDDLTRYSGLEGTLNKQIQSVKASMGKQSPEYNNYQKALQAVEFLTSQITQFYGSSIQPEMINRINKLSDTSFWNKSPELAKELFNTTSKILKQETQTYRDALKNTNVYEGKSSNGLTMNPTPKEAQDLINSGIAKGVTKNTNDPLGLR